MLLEKNKRWIRAIEQGVASPEPKQQKLVMKEAGKNCSQDMWTLCEKALGAKVESVADLVLGWNLVRQSRNLNGDWLLEENVVHGEFKE